jgi:hypothetical protein
MDLGKVIEWIKLDPEYLLPVVVATSVLLFSPRSLLSSIGLESFVREYRSWLGLVWLLSFALLSSHALTPFAKFIKRWVWEKIWIWHGRKRLQELTPSEKEILKGFLIGNTRSQYLDFQNGDVKLLERERIIFMASNTGNLTGGIAYNIQPWAWDYLRQNPQLLKER